MSELSIFEAITGYLDRNDYHYRVADDKHSIRFGAGVPIDHMERLDFSFVITPGGFTCYAVSPIGAGRKLHKMAEFEARANYGLRVGNFEMDFNDGEIRYKVHYHLSDDEDPSDEQVESSIMIPISMFKRYAPGMFAMFFNGMSPEEAVEKCENGGFGGDDSDDEEDFYDEDEEELEGGSEVCLSKDDLASSGDSADLDSLITMLKSMKDGSADDEDGDEEEGEDE